MQYCNNCIVTHIKSVLLTTTGTTTRTTLTANFSIIGTNSCCGVCGLSKFASIKYFMHVLRLRLVTCTVCYLKLGVSAKIGFVWHPVHIQRIGDVKAVISVCLCICASIAAARVLLWGGKRLINYISKGTHVKV